MARDAIHWKWNEISFFGHEKSYSSQEMGRDIIHWEKKSGSKKIRNYHSKKIGRDTIHRKWEAISFFGKCKRYHSKEMGRVIVHRK